MALTNAVEGHFLSAEKGAAITIDFIHVIAFLTLASAEGTQKRDMSLQLRSHS